MEKIVKMFWDCGQCGRKDIDGLIDICPSCGKQKSADVKYHLTNKSVEVSEEELNSAGIAKKECDGNHKEWVCLYCNQLNNWADKSCRACGAAKAEAEKEYGGTEIIKDTPKSVVDTPKPEHETEPEPEQVTSKKSKGGLVKALVAFITLFAVVTLFWPHTKIVTITDLSWNRCITVEEQKTIKESNWSVPSGGRVYKTKREFKCYRDVLDHYETVSKQKSRQVIDHYDISYTYEDNGNGTARQIEHKTPVYKTEYYTETEREPVYRQEPVYATKYYYEIDRWYKVQDYKSEGNDHEAYWNTDYTLNKKERDTTRSEKYYVHYNTGKKKTMSYDDWMSTNIGDSKTLTYCWLGITYKTAEGDRQ